MPNTKIKILEIAERLTQQRGFNGFSYLDLADEIGIKNSSIHFHYKTKAVLALALVERYQRSLMARLQQLENEETSPRKRLKQVVASFEDYIAEGKFCLCGMMAAELHSVSESVRKQLDVAFEELIRWIAKQFTALELSNPRKRAISFVAAAEGALLMARLKKDPKIVSKSLHFFF